MIRKNSFFGRGGGARTPARSLPRSFTAFLWAALLAGHFSVASSRADTIITPPENYQKYSHLVIARDGTVVVGRGMKTDGSGLSGTASDKLTQPIVSINTNSTTHPTNPGLGVPLPSQNNKNFITEGRNIGNGADFGAYAGKLILNIDKYDHDGSSGTPKINPLEGNAFGGIDVIFHNDGADVKGQVLKGSQVTDFDGDSTVETFLQEFEGKYPGFQFLPVGEVVEGLTVGEFIGFYLDEFAGGSADQKKTFEYRLLRHIGGAADETRAGVPAGAFTNDPVNLHRAQVDALAVNHNQLALDWAAANNQTDQIFANADGSIRIRILDSTTLSLTDSLDLTSLNGGMPLTLLVDKIVARKADAANPRGIKVPAGSTIVSTDNSGTDPGIFCTNDSFIEFVETPTTPPSAVNRVYSFDKVKDKNARAIRLASNKNDPDQQPLLLGHRDTLVVTDGIFDPTDGGTRIKVTAGDLTLHTAAKAGSGGRIEVDAGDLIWFTENTDQRLNADPDFRHAAQGNWLVAHDIFVACLGNLHFRNGGRIFAGGGGEDPSLGTADDRASGKIPTDANAKTRIFVGHKGIVGTLPEFTLGGDGNSTYLNPRMAPRNTTLVAKAGPSGYGVFRMGLGGFYGNLRVYAPDFYGHANTGGTAWHLRGAMVVKGFPDDSENILDHNGAKISGELVKSVSLTYDHGLKAGEKPPTLTLPDDITVEAPTTAGVTVDFVATAEDDEDGVLPVESSPASGSLLPPGLHIVKSQAVDLDGNVTEGTFAINVIHCKPVLTEIPAASGWFGSQSGFTEDEDEFLGYTVAQTAYPEIGSGLTGLVGQRGGTTGEFFIFRFGFSFDTSDLDGKPKKAELLANRVAEPPSYPTTDPYFITWDGDFVDENPTNDQYQVLWGPQPAFHEPPIAADYKDEVPHTAAYQPGAGEVLVKVGGKNHATLLAEGGSTGDVVFPLDVSAVGDSLFANRQGKTGLIMIARRDEPDRSPPDHFSATQMVFNNPKLRMWVLPDNALDLDLIGRPLDFGTAATMPANVFESDFDAAPRKTLSAKDEDDNAEDDEHDLDGDSAPAAAEDPGLFVGFNGDDDNRNKNQDRNEGADQIADVTANGQTFKEDDLQRLEIRMENIPARAIVVLEVEKTTPSARGRVKLWKSSKRGPDAPLLDASSGTGLVAMYPDDWKGALSRYGGKMVLWVEGVELSNAKKDVKARVWIKASSGEKLCVDTLDITVIGPTVQKDPSADIASRTQTANLADRACLQNAGDGLPATDRLYAYAFAPSDQVRSGDSVGTSLVNLFSYDTSGFFWKGGAQTGAGFSGTVERHDNYGSVSGDPPVAETSQYAVTINPIAPPLEPLEYLSASTEGFNVVAAAQDFITTFEADEIDTAVAVDGGRLICRLFSHLLPSAGIRPPGWMVKVQTVEPAIVVNLTVDSNHDGAIDGLLDEAGEASLTDFVFASGFGLPNHPSLEDRVRVVLSVQNLVAPSVPGIVRFMANSPAVKVFDQPTGGMPLTAAQLTWNWPTQTPPANLYLEHAADARSTLILNFRADGEPCIQDAIRLVRLSHGLGADDGISAHTSVFPGYASSNLMSGNLHFSVLVRSYNTPALGPSIVVSYNHRDAIGTALGQSWRTNYDMRVFDDSRDLDGDGTIELSERQQGDVLGLIDQTGRRWIPSHFESGRAHETARLTALGKAKETYVWRPTAEEVNSAAFKVVVGRAQATPGGRIRGTILDSSAPGFLEIKGGSSPLGSTYQMRLEVYRALKEGQTMTIETTRPVSTGIPRLARTVGRKD